MRTVWLLALEGVVDEQKTVYSSNSLRSIPAAPAFLNAELDSLKALACFVQVGLPLAP
jgi:hypothetical protein